MLISALILALIRVISLLQNPKNLDDINPFLVEQKRTEVDDYEPDTSVIDPHFSFILGPGHGFPALQANLFIDGDLEKSIQKPLLMQMVLLIFVVTFPGQEASRPIPARLLRV